MARTCFRVRPGDRLKRALAFLLSLPPHPDGENRTRPPPRRRPTITRLTALSRRPCAGSPWPMTWRSRPTIGEGLSIPRLVKSTAAPARDWRRFRSGRYAQIGSEAMALVHKKRKAQTSAAPPGVTTAAASAKPAKMLRHCRGRRQHDGQNGRAGQPDITATRAGGVADLNDPVFRGREIERFVFGGAFIAELDCGPAERARASDQRHGDCSKRWKRAKGCRSGARRKDYRGLSAGSRCTVTISDAEAETRSRSDPGHGQTGRKDRG